MLASLANLATETDSTKRRALLGSIADLFYNSGRDHILETEMALFAEVVTRLLKDVDEADRAVFSSVIAADTRTPHNVVMALASDGAAVAAPMLQHSPLLSDDDLVAIASSKSMEHRIAISKRLEVTERVTDVLVGFDEAAVMSTLLDNIGASLSDASFQQIAEKSKTDGTLRQRLTLRADAPAEIVRQLLPYMDTDARAKAERLMASSPNKLVELAQTAAPVLAHEKSERAKRRLGIKGLARQVEAGAVSMDGFVDDLVSQHQPLDLALGLAEISLLPEKQVANAVLSLDPEPLALICKALEMDADTYARAEALRCESMKLSSAVSQMLLGAYARLSVADAQRALRFVKLRANVAASG